MHKFTLALAAMAFLAGAGGARADDSGHIGINSLNAELPRSHDPLAPVSDGLSPSASDCTTGPDGLIYGCPTWRHW